MGFGTGDIRLTLARSAADLADGFLNKTIGYGYRPLLTVFWMLGVVTIGWMDSRWFRGFDSISGRANASKTNFDGESESSLDSKRSLMGIEIRAGFRESEVARS